MLDFVERKKEAKKRKSSDIRERFALERFGGDSIPPHFRFSSNRSFLYSFITEIRFIFVYIDIVEIM